MPLFVTPPTEGYGTLLTLAVTDSAVCPLGTEWRICTVRFSRLSRGVDTNWYTGYRAKRRNQLFAFGPPGLRRPFARLGAVSWRDGRP